MSMQIEVLGTGDADGIPALGCNCNICQRARMRLEPRRTRASLLISDSDVQILIDPSPDIFNQLNVDLIPNLILVTHKHLEHWYGIPLLHAAGRLFSEKLNKKIYIFSNKDTNKFLSKILAQFVQISNKYMKERFILNVINKKTKFENIYITPVELAHDVPTIGFLIEGTATVAYLTDTGSTATVFYDGSLDDVDLIFIDCTWARKENPYHMDINDILQLPRRNYVCTHIGHKNLPYEDMKNVLQGIATVPLDGQEFLL